MAAIKHKTIPNKKNSKKKGLHVLHLNINSLLSKIDEFFFIAKQSNGSIIWFNKLYIEDYNLIRLDWSRRAGEVACYIRAFLSFKHEQSFCGNVQDIFVNKNIFLAQIKTNFGRRYILTT